MTADLIIALALFAFVSSITPGPNNLMLMASGANFGFRRTVPHMLGVALGFVFLLLVAGAGLIRVFEIWPAVHAAMKAASVAYLLWLAWKIATAAPVGEGRSRGRPLTFLQAAAFQWVNPKAWAMALTAITVYAPDRSAQALLTVAALFGLVNLPSVGTWALIGQGLAAWLAEPRRLRTFNRVMALLMVATLWPFLSPS
ncbi:LysE family translocator [Jhaorihella thermophila]|uniref:Threonine/homoserine/homoserine lactone efflux protein n=1 Tax=Jhaorihella thermophila TaxID=488547 RepID=A0A1H5U7W2_9RHOB|nr:LysE family translocator [Jhaorihella thermophila]SEF71113.1 Threonine/homoserine/homoserine lactone efflux protein [Jhaorihella thermophila]